MKTYVIMGFVLFIVCAFAAGSLAFVYQGTKGKIAEQAFQEKQTALKEVFPQAEQFKEIEVDKHWEALNAGTKVGDVYAFEAKGYGGPISIVLGVDLEKKVNDIRILSHSETPGLGARITARQFLDQFAGKSAGELRLKKEDPQAGKIDAITAATISSRAVAEAVRNVITVLP